MDSSSQLPDDHEINRRAGEHEPVASTTPIPRPDSGPDPQPWPTPEPGVKKTTKKTTTRSANIGCFLYTGSNGMVMTEGLLFPTKKAARREIVRIAKMFAAWTGTWEEAARNPPTKE